MKKVLLGNLDTIMDIKIQTVKEVMRLYMPGKSFADAMEKYIDNMKKEYLELRGKINNE